MYKATLNLKHQVANSANFGICRSKRKKGKKAKFGYKENAPCHGKKGIQTSPIEIFTYAL